MTFSGTAAQAKLTFTGSGNLNIGGSISTGGTFTASTGTVNYNNLGAQTVNSYAYYNLTLSGSGDKTLAAATTISNNLYISSNTRLIDNQYQITGNAVGTLTVENNATLFLGQIALSGTISTVFPTNYTKNNIYLRPGSIVQYNSWVTQTISTIPDYYNVECQYPGTKQAASGTLTINGFFETASPLDLGTNNPTINLAGDFNLLAVGGAISLTSGVFSIKGNFNNTLTSGGSIATSNGTVVFNGSTAQEIKGTGNVATTFYNLTINNTSVGVTNTISGTNTSISVANVLTMTSGILTTSTSNLLNVTNTATSAIVGGTAASYINGPVNWTLKSSMASGSTYNFPIGKGGNYYPFSLVNPTTGTGTITAKVEAFNSNCGGNSNFTIPNALSTIGGLSTSEYWSLITSGNFTNSLVSITRPTSITPFDVIAGSNNATGTYSSIAGTVATNGISSSSAIGSNRFFTFGRINGIRIKGSIASSFCAGSSVTVNFDATGTYSSGNIFTAQLSDALGSFSSPTAIGTLSQTTTTGGTYAINATLPSNVVAGSGYLIRVVSSNPIVVGSDNGSGITINPNLPANVIIAATATTICSGSSVTFTSTPTNGGVPSYQWKINGISVGGATSSTFTTTTLANNDSVTVVMISNASPCLIGSPTTSNGITITVNSKPASPIIQSITPQTCTIATGSITLNNLPSAGNWTLTQSGTSSSTISGSGATTIINGLAIGTYAYSVTNSAGCTSIISNNATILGIVTTTWNGSAWLPSAPTSNDKIIFNGNYTSSSNIAGCSCQVSSGNVVISSGNTMTLTNELVVSGGTLTFENKASLVQTNSNITNSGNIRYQRETTPLKQYDYTYWSSPVTNATLSQLATNAALYSFDPSINNWVGQGGATVMNPGVGYIGRSPNNLTYSPTQVVETTFVGVPNNGNITASILKSVSTSNLIGNPYPSAIDADLFITDAANSNNINGTIYLWTHNTALTNNSFTQNDYAKYNLIGGVKTSSSALSGGVAPTGKIAAGQGFFVEANSSLANGTYSVTFKNSMRVASNNNQFYKSNQSNTVAIEKHRFWISLSTPQGAYNEFLIGYVQGATNSFDPLFDGRTLAAGNTVSIYSLLGNDNLAIQGRTLPFDASDIIPIGYTTSLTGQLTINLENFDGLFDNQNVYLFDNTTGIYHDLKSNAFTFTTTSGTFNNRFELRFNLPALNNNVTSNSENKITIFNIDNQLVISSKNNAISKVEIYDVLGKLLFTKNELTSNEFETTINNISSQLLIVKVTLDNQQTITKKISLK